MDWTDELIARLRTLWAEGHSTAEIGRRMGISKNAVVGKAHRLQLSARPSPIQRGGVAPRRPPAAPRQTMQPSQARPSAPPGLSRDRPEGAPPALPPAPALRTVPPMARSSSRNMPCCWPIGEPGSPGFRFCDEAAVSGKPYCEAHVQLAYVKVRDRREDAA